FPACLQVGELVYAGYMTYNRVWLLVENGASLDRVGAAAHDDVAFAEQHHNQHPLQVVHAEEQFVASLKGLTRAPPSFDHATFSEAELLEVLERAGFGVGLAFFHVMKQMAAFIHGRFEEARESAARAASVLREVTGIATEATHHFYRALTLAALYSETGV